MNETVNANEPAPTNSGASPLTGTGGVNRETHGNEEWLRQKDRYWSALMERDLKPCELRAAWPILCWSVELGRHTTGPFTMRELAVGASLTTATAHRGLKGLERKQIICKNGDGWRFMPETKFHTWLVPWRADDGERKQATRRVDEAQGVAGSCQASAVSYQPEDGGTKNGNKKSEIGDWKAGAIQNKEQKTKDTMNMKDENADNHGTHETHGNGGKDGDGVFLPPDVANVAMPAPDAPLKSSPPSPKTPFNTVYNSLKGESVASLATTPEASPIEGNGTEAGMEKGSPIPEDPMDASEDTLMRRLTGLLDKETMKKKGGNLRLFIRGSLEAADCPDTAIAVRKAINDTEAAQREGRIKKSVFGYLYRQAFYWAGQMGWRFNAAKKEWTKGEKFNNWKHLNANRRRK